MVFIDNEYASFGLNVCVLFEVKNCKRIVFDVVVGVGVAVAVAGTLLWP